MGNPYGKNSPNTEQRIQLFWDKVDKQGPEDCWNWKGCKYGYKNRYGGFQADSGFMLAHRYSYELHSGKVIPTGKMALHKCNNPKCVNPAHLYVGDARQNALDRRDNGFKQARNFTGSPPVLYDEDLEDIKKQLRRGQGVILARKYGVSEATISKIKTTGTCPTKGKRPAKKVFTLT